MQLVRRHERPKPAPTATDRFNDAVKIWSQMNDSHGVVSRGLRGVWRRILRGANRQMAESLVRGYALADAMNQSIDMVKFGLRIEDADIETKKWLHVINGLLHLEVAQQFVAQSNLDDTSKRQITDRLIASSFPTPSEKRDHNPMQPRQNLTKQAFDAIMAGYSGNQHGVRENQRSAPMAPASGVVSSRSRGHAA